jgi:hypothetical protein
MGGGRHADRRRSRRADCGGLGIETARRKRVFGTPFRSPGGEGRRPALSPPAPLFAMDPCKSN